MKAEFDDKGMLSVVAENNTERVALKSWFEGHYTEISNIKLIQLPGDKRIGS